MGTVQIVTAVLFANGLTLTAIYAWWRINKNEQDWKAILLAIVVSGVAIALGLAAQA